MQFKIVVVIIYTTMNDFAPQDIWSRALDIIKTAVAEGAYQMWFANTKARSVSGETLNISVPDDYSRTWILGHYEPIIKDAVRSASGERLLSIALEPSAEPLAAPAPPADERVVFSSSQTLNSKYTFDNFVIGAGNRFAHAAALAVADSPAKAYNPLFIYGGVGLGKTHLMQAISHYILSKTPGSKLCYITGERFTNELIASIQYKTTLRFRERYRNVDILLIDDVHFLAGKESTQEEFFHTFNTLYDSHKQIVLSSDRPPKDIPTLEKRLVSRFVLGLVTDIQPPDLETRIAILKKKAEIAKVSVPDDVAFFIAEKIKANIRELEGALIRVVAYSVMVGERMEIPLAERVLKDMFFEGSRVDIELIQKRVAEHFNIRPSDMRSKRRTRAVAYPRQVAIYIARALTDRSLVEIGDYFGGRDHTTILHAYNKIKGEIEKNKETGGFVSSLIKDIKG